MGEAGLWLLVFIYGRTLMKILLGKGHIARRLLPEYTPQVNMPVLHQWLGWLNRTHVYFGITAVVIIVMHIILMGIPMQILFFPAVLALVIWQGYFWVFFILAIFAEATQAIFLPCTCAVCYRHYDRRVRLFWSFID